MSQALSPENYGMSKKDPAAHLTAKVCGFLSKSPVSGFDLNVKNPLSRSGSLSGDSGRSRRGTVIPTKR